MGERATACGLRAPSAGSWLPVIPDGRRVTLGQGFEDRLPQLLALAEAAATWQTRAEVLALQLEDARAQLALGAPMNAPESRPGGPERAESGRMVPESTPAPSGPWWRRWWRALLGAPG